MNTKLTLLYYATAAVTSLILIISILSILNWPLVAELAFGSTLFLHALLLTKTAKDMFISALDKGMVHQFLYTLRPGAEMPEQNREV